MTVDVSEILYSAINEIGKDKIRTDLNSDLGSSEKHIMLILAHCKNALGEEAYSEVMAGFCEGLLHFMLTASQLPSQRKLEVRGFEIDVVIPSARLLLREPENALVIQVYRSEKDFDRISNARSVQPRADNLWVVSGLEVVKGYRNYSAGSDNSFSQIIVDIERFVKDKGITGLKLFQGE